MVTFIFILAFIATFFVGFALALIVAAIGIRAEAEEGKGCWLMYNKRKDEWVTIGDLPMCYAKAFRHHKPIRRVLEG